MSEKPKKPIEQVIRADGRYPIEAYAFLHEALRRAVAEAHGEQGEAGPQHVTGPQICAAVRELALSRWGMLARTVLRKWNVHATIDFGNMVYLLIENGDWKKQPEDSIEDFRDVYDLDEAFDVVEKFEVRE